MKISSAIITPSACNTRCIQCNTLSHHLSSKHQSRRVSASESLLKHTPHATHLTTRRYMVCSASSPNQPASSQQLLIAGPGVLGSYLGKLWLDKYGPGTVVGQTNTTKNHNTLQTLGIIPRTKAEATPSQKFPFVAYCAPPSGSENYPEDIASALRLWDGTGSFLFTSSAGVYAVDDCSECNEDAPLMPLGSSDRTDALLLAEKAVLDAGGCVLRLVGLYHKTRGAHSFFLKQGEVPRWGGYTVNLIHYEDAAGMGAAILQGQGSSESSSLGYRGEVFLGCDGHPVTFDAMMKAIELSQVLEGSVKFTGAEGPVKGKNMRNEKSRMQLQWEPKYSSIEAFFGNGGEDWYSQGLGSPGLPHE